MAKKRVLFGRAVAAVATVALFAFALSAQRVHEAQAAKRDRGAAARRLQGGHRQHAPPYRAVLTNHKLQAGTEKGDT